MDDDSIPSKGALQSLINKSQMLDDNFSFLASLIYWKDGKLFPMNAPVLSSSHPVELRFDLTSKFKVIKIRSSSFVGCYVNLKKCALAGLPITEFFIYGDDVEYTMRIEKIAPAYIDLDSVIVHKAPSNTGVSPYIIDSNKIERLFYSGRNTMYIARKYRQKFKKYIDLHKKIGAIILKSKDKKFKRLYYYVKGTIAGLFFNPKIEFVKSRRS